MADGAQGDRDAWLALVQKTLKDGDVGKLTKHTPDGLTIAPLYTAADAPEAASLRLAPRDPERPWDVRTITAHASPAAANEEILADLQGGAASVIVTIDPSGDAGVAIGSADALGRTLDGVILELAPVGLDAGFLGAQAADWLATAAKSAPAAPLMLHLDPLSAFARTGTSPGPIEAHVSVAAATGARLEATYPKASLFLASGRVVHEAGGSAASELGVAAASALAYAKALTGAGLGMEAAFSRITLGLAADAQHFKTIAKLRAARLIWERMTSACGVRVPAVIEARSSRRMLAARDVWTNMLRLTIAGFGAAAGGADAIALGAFTDPLGAPTAFARRQSRNAQLVLMEEAHVGAVVDPGRGAWFVESLTDQLARAGWTAFQAIETQGGVIKALQSGQVAAAVAATREAELSAAPPVVGLTIYPSADNSEPAVEPIDSRAFAIAAAPAAQPGADSACPPLAGVAV